MCADDCSGRDMALHGWVGMNGTFHEPTAGPQCVTHCTPDAGDEGGDGDCDGSTPSPTKTTAGSAENRQKWYEARVAWLMQPDNPVIGEYLARIREINKKYCQRGARDGCGWANLADGILMEEHIREVAGRIDESAVPFRADRFKTLTKKGSNLTTYSFSNPEYALAWDIASGGSKVASVPESNVPKVKSFDAYVDGVPSEFKIPPGSTKDTVQNNLKNMEGKGAVRAYIQLKDGYSSGQAMESLKRYLGSTTAPFSEYYIQARGDLGGWMISGKVGSDPKCKGWGC
ncbi:hypothetical protein [Kitasatospora sp. NPDC094011]|uniref:hypothetical protein n=1 Tax=Kitasatospora sp. NPDC094011 TaxID=3364090 RepID=UPI00381D431B